MKVSENKLLKGSTEWNKWRNENPDITPKIIQIDVPNINLEGYDLSNCSIDYVDFSGANLKSANLEHCRIGDAKFDDAEFAGAKVSDCYFMRTKLNRADFSHLTLGGTEFSECDLIGSKFYNSKFYRVVFTDTNLSSSVGLESCEHAAPSIIDHRTIGRSGQLPRIFLEGCGLSDWLIEAYKLTNPALSNEEINNVVYKVFDRRAHRAVQISNLFVSYSHADSTFVDKIQNKFKSRGIRCWRDIHDATSGRMEKIVDRAIRLNPTVLLILSKNSIESDWVQHEARKARALQIELKRDVLCPLALDDSWKNSTWPQRLTEQIKEYNILDFKNWDEDKKFSEAYDRLERGLEIFYSDKQD